MIAQRTRTTITPRTIQVEVDIEDCLLGRKWAAQRSAETPPAAAGALRHAVEGVFFGNRSPDQRNEIREYYLHTPLTLRAGYRPHVTSPTRLTNDASDGVGRANASRQNTRTDSSHIRTRR